MKTILYTIIALVAFAGNSVLCRYALKGDAIDASSFTSIRLLSGAVFLITLVMLKNKGTFDFKGGSWLSAVYLFVYMVTFSYAYITLDTGIGALILFGAVQMTMIIFSMLKGKKLQWVEWVGLIIAFAGLALLLLPSGSAPSLMGFVLMAISGIAWGGYTLAGKGAKSPLIATSNNFLKTVPFVIALFLFTFDSTTISNDGVILAVVSGALTSGLGYAIWYAALEGLKVTQAAVLQLTVPIIASFGGVIFSSEVITLQLVISSLCVLGGILIITLGAQIVVKKS